MRRCLVLAALAASAAACTENDVLDPDELSPPTDLTYQLMPSGDPELPEGLLLRWTDPIDDRITNFVVYSRASTANSWALRGTTTSASFHDVGLPHLQYYVASEDDVGNQSRASNTVTVDERNRLPAPSELTSISLDGGVQVSWPDNARLADPDLFDYYRVYSTSYDLDAGVCDGGGWVLEGTTVSEDFLATGLPNGSPRCFSTSTVSFDGHESVWTEPRADTPRYDARNVLVYARQASLAQSGFRFFIPGDGSLGVVMHGDRSDLDFRVDRRADGSLWLQPVRSDVRVRLYDNRPVADLTSIDIAPLGGFSSAEIQALPGFGYVFETLLDGALHYGAIRVTEAGTDYLILDWAFQTDPGNPELRRAGPGGEPAI